MIEGLGTILLIGVSLAGVSILIVLPAAHLLLRRLFDQYAPLDPTIAAMRGNQSNIKYDLDWFLASGLCMSALFVTLNWGASWHAVMAALYCATLQLLARIDQKIHLLPDILTLPLLWAGLLFQWSGGWVTLEDAVAGTALGYGILWLVWAAFRGMSGRDGIGFGDLKLAAAIGAWLGLDALPWVLLSASLAGSFVTLLGRLRGRLARLEPIAFGPYLAISGILVLLCTQNRLSFLSIECLTALRFEGICKILSLNWG
jgi:prepilin signal peptidase PulO-like enzyme (type II secretory pathway)